MDQTSKILDKGNFKLRTLWSNVPTELGGVAKYDKESYLNFNYGTDITKTLGLAWIPFLTSYFSPFRIYIQHQHPVGYLCSLQLCDFTIYSDWFGLCSQNAKFFLSKSIRS